MKHRIPPLSALLALEALSRHLNFTRAGLELGLTQAAVSFQIKSLEGQLGVQLFDRSTRAVALTEAGERYVASILEPLRMLAQAGAALADPGKVSKRIRILCTQAFASLWLVPRITRIRAASPALDIEVVSWPGGHDDINADTLRRHDVHACVAYSADGLDLRALRARTLASDYALPVCGAAPAAGMRPLQVPGDLQGQTLLHALNWREMWPQWLRVHAPAIRPGSELYLQDTALTVQAASNGVGVAIAHGPLIEREVAAGRLRVPFAKPLPLDHRYVYVYPEGVATDDPVSRFGAWMELEFQGVHAALFPDQTDVSADGSR